MKIQYTPHGVCSRLMEITIEEEKIKELKIVGGCSGNSRGICALVKGMEIRDVIARLDGLRCENKETSCPGQLAEALKKCLIK